MDRLTLLLLGHTLALEVLVLHRRGEVDVSLLLVVQAVMVDKALEFAQTPVADVVLLRVVVEVLVAIQAMAVMHLQATLAVNVAVPPVQEAAVLAAHIQIVVARAALVVAVLEELTAFTVHKAVAVAVLEYLVKDVMAL